MSTTDSQEARFAICLRNDGYAVSLEPRKLYQFVPDPEANERGLVRIVDESGEDYLYPADYFIELPLPEAVERALRRAS